ncbi:MAG: ATP-binding protein [Tepidimonas sp.]|uniref:ATP-binding protein n=1 Tax=Tepidimonas sp. TaxID=2002775 RepID=UPI00259E1851|nr:ATP-binding protein [Tepidimonas sp.]MDM7457707.1 ATP-binding protein [Tepidimonas sp.]
MEPYDVFVLDLGLPQLDGLTVLQRWRAEGVTAPVLIPTARAASAAHPGRHTPVQPLLEGLLRVMRKVHATRPNGAAAVALTLAGDPAVVFAGEAQDLQEMAGNLLDNACKWARQRVQVTVRRDGQRLQLTVDDDGPGLRPEQCQQVLARGVRADERVPGSGLGLDIVREVAALYGGTLTLARAPQGGLRAALELPAVTND